MDIDEENNHESDHIVDHFDSVREQLRNWPYTLHQIEDTLDIALIEGRGKQLLFQAINAQNLQAFAGSGLSMSYGRMSWQQWQKEQTRVIERNAMEFCELSTHSIAFIDTIITLLTPENLLDASKLPIGAEITSAHKTIQRYDEELINHSEKEERKSDSRNIRNWLKARKRSIDYAHRQISRLKDTFILTQDSDGGFPGGEELPVKFEIAQQLQSQLRLNTGQFLPKPRKTTPLYDPSTDYRRNACFGCLYVDVQDAPGDAIERFIQLIHKLEIQHLLIYDEAGGNSNNAKAYYKSLDAYYDSMSRPETQFSFDRLAKYLLIDECPHALLLLRQGLSKTYDLNTSTANNSDLNKLEDKLALFENANLKRDVDGLRENPERFKVLSPFRYDNFFSIASSAKKGYNQAQQDQWLHFDNIVDDDLPNYFESEINKPNRRIYLTPSSRFLVPIYLARCERPYLAIQPLADSNGYNNPILATPSLNDFHSRRSIIADRFDPLAKSESLLGITQYITTNYDFEIERYFQDRGYRDFPPVENSHEIGNIEEPGDNPDGYRLDGLGRRLKDQTFSRERASELVSFTLDQSKNTASVYHLHGRATKNDKLVITERDYLSLYLTQDSYRDTVDEGIRIAFAGAPLLFLGLGMNETDLLRPLRQFISNRDRTIGYTSIALLPAEGSFSNRTKFSSALYLRYGIHTIFYGSGQTYFKNQAVGIDWLHRIMQLRWAIDEELKLWAQGNAAEDRTPQEILAKIDDTVHTIGPYLADEEIGYKEDTSALKVILGIGDSELTGENLATRLINERVKSNSNSSNKDTTTQEIKKYYLNCCEFVPARPNRKNTHHRDPECKVAGHEFLGFYTKLLDEIFKMTLELPLIRKKQTSLNIQELIAPMQMALGGLHGAFITGSLNAELELISREHKLWWKNWQQSPPHRIPEIQCLGGTGKVSRSKIATAPDLPYRSHEKVFKFGSAYVRHRVNNVITPMSTIDSKEYEAPLLAKKKPNAPQKLHKKNRTGIRAFDTFIAAAANLDHYNSTTRDHEKKRIIFTVAAYRGLGKGSFISAFTTELGRRAYVEAVWHKYSDKNKIVIASSAFLNLSFSPEIASVYDMIVNLLIEVIAHLTVSTNDLKNNITRTVEDTNNEEFIERDNLRKDIIRLPRFTATTILFEKFSIAAEEHREVKSYQPRLFICLSAIELLFDQEQRPKNGEISELLDMLFGRKLEKCPVDIVFVGDENALGPPWNQPCNLSRDGENGTNTNTPTKYLTHCKRLFNGKGITQQAIEQVTRRSENGKIAIDDATKNPSHIPFHNIHYARPVSPVTILLHNFRTLSIALYLQKPPLGINGSTIEGADDSLETVKRLYDSTVRQAKYCSDKRIETLWSVDKLPTAAELASARDMVRNLGIGVPLLEVDSDGIADSVNKLSSALQNHYEKIKHINEANDDVDVSIIDQILKKRLKDTNQDDAYEWRLIRRWIGGSRFSITILLAVAEHIVVHSPKPSAAAEQAAEFIVDTVDSIRNIGQERRDQIVLEKVLAKYRQYHLIGDSDLDNELHMLVIRHLGVIGTPTSAAILVRLPEFRNYFKRIGISLKISRRRFLVRAMTTLAYRGLVFRLEPHPFLTLEESESSSHSKNIASNDPQQDFRYSLHRIVQSHALSMLQSEAIDPVAINSFAPTIYASMTSTGPRLSRDSYRFLRSLMIGLSQYPDVRNADDAIEPWIFASANRSLQVQAVRSALTMARSTFSVAVVSRLADHTPIGEGIQKRGYFETYRVRLRWIVRMAWESLKHTNSKNPETTIRRYRPDNDFSQVNALYRDEIVWIYNELGVISLAQGSLTESLGYLRQAAEFNTDIEGPSKNGPIFSHIDLNHAIVQMERGSLKSARARLQRVCRSSEVKSKKLFHIAEGYQCVLEHIMGGGLQDTDKKFKRVTDYFQEHREIRAAAIFLGHYGRFLAIRDHEGAVRQIEMARDLAETGGHEDIRQQIELARLKIQWLDPSSEDMNTSNKLLQLKDIEDYGRRMGIWSLQSDALNHRATVLLRQGETATAGRLLIRSMAIAKRNAMALRLNNAMTNYAETLLVRGDFPGAEKIARQSLEKAKTIGYNLETPRAQGVLKRVLNQIQ